MVRMVRNLTIIAALFLASCAEPATPVAVEGAQADFKVGKLFSVNGCTVYRFFDDGRYRYFSDCRGSVTHSESCGKSCVREVEIPTSGR